MIADQVLSNALAISAGVGHSLALKSDGTVVGWGGNGQGIALGYETPYPGRTNGVVRINGQILSNVISVVASRDFSLALKKDGTLVAWGQQQAIGTAQTLSDNNVEESPMRFDPTTGLPVPTKVEPIKKSISVGVINDGTVVTRVGNQEPTPLTNITAIAAEWGASWVVKRDGTVVGWTSQPSSNKSGQLLPVEGLSNVVGIAMGPGEYVTQGIALKNDGTVGIWGSQSINKEATPPIGLSNVVAIAAGDGQTLALKSDGTVIGWGFNKVGQATGVPTTNSPNISAGQVIIGGQILSNVVSIAANRGYSMALKSDGMVVMWGRRMVNDLYPATVPTGLSNVVAIAAGQDFCLAITTNKAVADKFRQK